MNLLFGAHDFPYLFLKQAANLWSIPLTWNLQSHDSLGVFTLSTLWTWPYGLFYGLLAKLGLNFSISIWILGVLPAFLLGWIGMGKLLKSYQISDRARIIGQILFVSNTYVLMLLDGGQLSIALAYSLMPLAIYNLPFRFNFILSIIVISFLDIRYLYLLALPIFIKMVFDLRNVKKYLFTGLLTGLFILGMHSYWILPAIFSRGPALPTTYTRQGQVEALSFATLGHAILFIHPNWPKNIFGQVSNPIWFFVFIPVLVFLPLAFKKKHTSVGIWAVVGLVSIFLIKGSGDPFPMVYAWLFKYVPGFSLFRDSSKFYSLLAISYSVLIAFSSDFIFYYRKKLFWFVLVYLLFLLSPIFLGQTTGLFSYARDRVAYSNLANYLDKDNDNNSGGLMWIPSKPPLGFASPTYPSMDALTLLDKRPFTTGVVGSYELLNFLRDSSYSGQLLDIAAIKYIGIAALDPKRDSQKIEDIKYHDIFTNQLATLSWVKSRLNFGPVTLLETEIHQPTFFIPQETVFVVGSDDVYNDIPKLNEQGLVFVENEPQLLTKIAQYPEAKVLLNNKASIDLAAALIPKTDFIFPGNSLDFSPNSTGWWKRQAADLISWRDFLQQKYHLDNQDFDYGGGWAISEGEHILTVKPTNVCKIDCILLARVMTSPQSGKITFSNSHGNLGEIETKADTNIISTQKLTGYGNIPDKFFTYTKANFNWFEVTKLSNDSDINISTQGNINVLNALVIMPTNVWQEYKIQAKNLESRPANISINDPVISFTKTNPTHYHLKISGLVKPATLAFVQNYDSFWRLSDQSPVPLYSFINGFNVAKNGEYDLEFLPQRYVGWGLLISFITAGLFAVILRYAPKN